MIASAARMCASYLAVLVLASAACAIGYSTGAIDAAGLYVILFAGLLIFAVGAARREQRHPHQR